MEAARLGGQHVHHRFVEFAAGGERVADAFLAVGDAEW